MNNLSVVVGLIPSQSETVGKTAAYYGKNSWRDATYFDPKEAYYVYIKLHHTTLAEETMRYSCGSTLLAKKCRPNELEKKVTELLNHNSLYYLYGKYKSRWKCFKDGEEIPDTAKFEGHNTLWIERDKESKIDELIVGPIPFMADEIALSFYYTSALMKFPVELN